MIHADIIAQALYDWAGSGQGVDDILEAISRSQSEAVLRALEAAGYRIEKDDPATTVYGRLLHRHMAAARKDFDGERRKKLFDLMEDFRAEFPDECQVWEDRYDPAIRSLQENSNAR